MQREYENLATRQIIMNTAICISPEDTLYKRIQTKLYAHMSTCDRATYKFFIYGDAFFPLVFHRDSLLPALSHRSLSYSQISIIDNGMHNQFELGKCTFDNHSNDVPFCVAFRVRRRNLILFFVCYRLELGTLFKYSILNSECVQLFATIPSEINLSISCRHAASVVVAPPKLPV